jgi:hypothetical protein
MVHRVPLVNADVPRSISEYVFDHDDNADRQLHVCVDFEGVDQRIVYTVGHQFERPIRLRTAKFDCDRIVAGSVNREISEAEEYSLLHADGSVSLDVLEDSRSISEVNEVEQHGPRFYFAQADGAGTDHGPHRDFESLGSDARLPLGGASGYLAGVRRMLAVEVLAMRDRPELFGRPPERERESRDGEASGSGDNSVVVVKPIEQPQNRGRYDIPTGALIWGAILALAAYFGKVWAEYRYRKVVERNTPKGRVCRY